MGGTISGGTQKWTFTAGEAITAGRLCYLKSDGCIYMIDDTTKPPLIRADEAIASGAKGVCDVIVPIVLMEVGAAGCTIGSLVEASTNGVVVDASTDNAWIAGQSLETGTVGAQVSVMWAPHVTNDVSALDAD